LYECDYDLQEEYAVFAQMRDGILGWEQSHLKEFSVKTKAWSVYDFSGFMLY